MKRRIGETELSESADMADCLISLSRARDTVDPGRVFECKTCSRQFPSFQALGGHRASHKKPRPNPPDDHNGLGPGPARKPKTHECPVCGLEFAIGQALGGHMRRHRSTMMNGHDHHDEMALRLFPSHEPLTVAAGPVVKKSSGRRVLCLDLNLTPTENDLEFFRLMKVGPPVIDCSI